MDTMRARGRGRLTVVEGTRPASGARVALSGGAEVSMRVAGRDDAEAVRAMHDRCSAETRRLRYFTSIPRLPEDALLRILVPRSGLTLVAVDTDGSIGAMATLYHEPGTDLGEVALLVEDTWQHQGLGTLLLHMLVRLAEEREMTVLRAQVLPWNRRMLELFDRTGLTVRRRFEDGVVLVEAALTRRDEPEIRCA